MENSNWTYLVFLAYFQELTSLVHTPSKWSQHLTKYRCMQGTPNMPDLSSRIIYLDFNASQCPLICFHLCECLEASAQGLLQVCCMDIGLVLGLSVGGLFFEHLGSHVVSTTVKLWTNKYTKITQTNIRNIPNKYQPFAPHIYNT